MINGAIFLEAKEEAKDAFLRIKTSTHHSSEQQQDGTDGKKSSTQSSQKHRIAGANKPSQTRVHHPRMTATLPKEIGQLRVAPYTQLHVPLSSDKIGSEPKVTNPRI